MVFLQKEYESIQQSEKYGKLRCCIRNREIQATPEEYVRQTLLRFLLAHLNLATYLIQVETGRKDIQILDQMTRISCFIVECKRRGISVFLSPKPKKQLLKYFSPYHEHGALFSLDELVIIHRTDQDGLLQTPIELISYIEQARQEMIQLNAKNTYPQYKQVE